MSRDQSAERRANGIEISGMSVELGGRAILQDVSFEAEPGGFLYVIGRNGAGKSTLLKCIAGVIGSYSGKLVISGREASSLSARDRARLVAYVPQSSPADVPYTVLDFIEMSRYPWRGVSSEADDRRAVTEAMELTGIAPFADRRLSSLSGGERQKVMIASAIAQESGTILMDEPTTYLDYAHQVETIDVMARVNRERGVTMIVVTHDVNLAMGLSGKLVAMSGGRVEWTGPPAGLLEPGWLHRIFGVSFSRYSSGRDGEFPILVPERGILRL
ncbi:MAG: ABC transporter ATP-binding protein [Synergistaceae bacterium]|jgi:iron complex transport system ATP-binding protein|nr:ABC transporter ATP-binding protein [Synergistaceae bacterium]